MSAPDNKRRRRKDDEIHMKDVMKEAIKEWLDEKYVVIGKWTINGIIAAALAALAYFTMWSHGWSINK